jgi:hypothetical protein
VRRAVVGVAAAVDQMCFPCHREHGIFLPFLEHVEQQQSSRERRGVERALNVSKKKGL